MKENGKIVSASENCKNYKNCNAPVCPLNKESLEFCKTLPDEEMCEMWKERKWRMALPKEIRDHFQNAQILHC